LRLQFFNKIEPGEPYSIPSFAQRHKVPPLSEAAFGGRQHLNDHIIRIMLGLQEMRDIWFKDYKIKVVNLHDKKPGISLPAEPKGALLCFSPFAARLIRS